MFVIYLKNSNILYLKMNYQGRFAKKAINQKTEKKWPAIHKIYGNLGQMATRNVAHASPSPTIMGVISVPERNPRSWPPPCINGWSGAWWESLSLRGHCAGGCLALCTASSAKASIYFHALDTHVTRTLPEKRPFTRIRTMPCAPHEAPDEERAYSGSVELHRHTQPMK
jgi:hypothetical protein